MLIVCFVLKNKLQVLCDFHIIFKLQNLQDGNSNILQPLIDMFWTLLPPYFFCHIGNNVTQRFEDVGTRIYDLSWYMLPASMRKKLPLVIAVAQKNIFIRGFGNIHFTHEVFRKVMVKFKQKKFMRMLMNSQICFSFQFINTTYSFFMVLRELDF